MDHVRSVMEEIGIPTDDQDAPLLELFGDEFSSRWGEVIAAIEERASVTLAPEDIPLGMTLRELIAMVTRNEDIRD